MNPAENPKDVALILVGLNACNFIKQCIQSVHKAVWRGWTYELIYVDNGSTDLTLPTLEKEFPEVKVIANATNLGFCKGANQGARIANSRYYFFINDDTLILEDAVAQLVEFMDREPRAGIAGS